MNRLRSHVLVLLASVTALVMAASLGARKRAKGRHKAGLKFGDCFAYALAKDLDEPLLFKGADFGHTDVEAAEF